MLEDHRCWSLKSTKDSNRRDTRTSKKWRPAGKQHCLFLKPLHLGHLGCMSLTLSSAFFPGLMFSGTVFTGPPRGMPLSWFLILSSCLSIINQNSKSVEQEAGKERLDQSKTETHQENTQILVLRVWHLGLWWSLDYKWLPTSVFNCCEETLWPQATLKKKGI